MGPGIQGPKILQNISFKAAWFWRGLRVVKNEAKGPRPSKVRIEVLKIMAVPGQFGRQGIEACRDESDGGSGGPKSSPILGPALPCLQKTPAGVGIAWIWRGQARGQKNSPF